MKFRLTRLSGVILFASVVVGGTGCSAESADSAAPDPKKLEAEKTAAASAPLVGTWRWSGSGQKLGDIALGEDHFVFHEDGTYSSFSVSGEGERDCYNGLFSLSGLDAQGHATIIFKSDRVRSAPNGFESEVYFESGDAIDFGPAGRYIRSAPLPVRCP